MAPLLWSQRLHSPRPWWPNNATNSERFVTTDENGFYTETNLPVGTYTIEAEQKGYKKALVSGQNNTADARLTVDLKLEAGEISETVEIVAAEGGSHSSLEAGGSVVV